MKNANFECWSNIIFFMGENILKKPKKIIVAFHSFEVMICLWWFVYGDGDCNNIADTIIHISTEMVFNIPQEYLSKKRLYCKVGAAFGQVKMYSTDIFVDTCPSKRKVFRKQKGKTLFFVQLIRLWSRFYGITKESSIFTIYKQDFFITQLKKNQLFGQEDTAFLPL